MRTRRSSHTVAASFTARAEGDRARAFVTGLRESIEAASVLFARYDQRGAQAEVILEDVPEGSLRELRWLDEEFAIQSEYDAALPRVTDVAVDLEGMHGLVAAYGSIDAILGLAILIRKRAFGANDRRTLESTLAQGTELLRKLATFDGEHTAQERTAERATPAQFVLSPGDLAVEWKWVPRHDVDDALHTILENPDGLPPVIETAVRELTAGWTDDPAS